MSGFLQSLVSADDACGPVNPLASLVKGVHGEGSQLGRDRFAPLPGSPSSAGTSFRTQPLHPSEAQADAQARAFFEQSQLPQHHHVQGPYHFDALQRALPAPGGWSGDVHPHAEMSERAWEKSRAFERPASAPVPAWAADFAREQLHDSQRMATPDVLQNQQQQQPQQGHRHVQSMPMGMMQGPMMPLQQFMQQPMMPGYMPYESQQHMMVQEPAVKEATKVDRGATTSNWEAAFLEHLEKSSTVQQETPTFDASRDTPHESLTARPHSPSQLPQGNDQDMLSKTAGELLQNLSHDMQTNTKMRESSFMNLMKRLRDKEVTVKGDQMVQQGESATLETATTTNLAPHAQATSVPVDFSKSTVQPICVFPQTAVREGQFATSQSSETKMEDGRHTPNLEELQAAYDEMNASLDDETVERAKRAFQGDGGGAMALEDFDEDMGLTRGQTEAMTAVPGATSAWEEDFDFDTQLLRNGPAPPTMEDMLYRNAQQDEWASYQEQFDSLDATSTGLQSRNVSILANYPFHVRNPYMLNRQHRQHLPRDTLLEKEADVQAHPDSSLAWLGLGLKQQENEREALAISALQRAVELDPQMKEAWLALAVSYTNDNLRHKAYDAMEKWMDCNTQYSDTIGRFRAGAPHQAELATVAERHSHLTRLIVEMARAGAQQVDADVQIALGVLFNASEEYDKAGDCFMSALSVRPDDPHLFNRLGATLANSGKADEALEYYYRALELQPDFARATFNLAIACMNLGSYEEAAMHLLQALHIQQDNNTDADVGEPSLAHLSEQELMESSNLLWDTLASCCNSMGRPELASACRTRNLSAFREFQTV